MKKVNVFLCRKRHLRNMSMQNWADVSNWKIWLNRMFNILLYLKFNQNSRNYSASPLRRVVKKLIFYEISVWFTTNPTFPWLGKCQITVVQLFPTCTFFAEKYFPELEINFAFLHWVGEAPCSLQLRVRKTLRLFSTHIFNGSRLCTTACLLGTSRHWSLVPSPDPGHYLTLTHNEEQNQHQTVPSSLYYIFALL